MISLEKTERQITNMGFEKDAIYFENIKFGFDNYNNEKIVLGEEEAFQFFKKKAFVTEKDSVYVDFYYGRLEEDARKIIDNQLTEEEKEYIQHTVNADEIIYKADEIFLRIVTKLNAREILFSTIYFTGKIEERSTWWGNYNQEYFVFREK